MHRGLIISVLLHTLVVLAFAIGLPFVSQPKAQRVAEIPVEFANISDITNPPKGKAKAKATKPKKARKARAAKPVKPKPPKAKPKAVKKPTPPAKKQVATLVQPTQPAAKPKPKKTPPKKAAPAKPKITSRPTRRPQRQVRKAVLPKPVKKAAKKPVKKAAAPKNDKAVKKAKPKKKPKKVAEKPKPKPKKKPVKKVTKKKPAKKVAKKTARKPAKKVVRKPKRKTRQVASRKPRSRPRRKKRMDDIYSFLKKKKTGKARTHQTAQRRAERRGSRSHRPNLPLSISERMAIARQIKPCWRFPLGAKDERTLRVEIRVWMGRDGKPIRHQILDRSRYGRDPFFRAAADAGIRAIYNPRCLPIRLPARKYDTWRVMILDFDPAKVSEGSL